LKKDFGGWVSIFGNFGFRAIKIFGFQAISVFRPRAKIGYGLKEYFSGSHWWQEIWASGELDLGRLRGSWNFGVDLKFSSLKFNKIFYRCASKVLTVRSHPATTNFHLEA
jgi:hypothetical protein